MGVHIYAACLWKRICVSPRKVCLCVCVPVKGLVSLILLSVAGAPRSSFSRAMTRSKIVMKLLIYRASHVLWLSTDVGLLEHAVTDVSFVVGVLT